MKALLFRPRPLHGESLTSYLSRVATNNLSTPYELLNLLLPEGIKKPQYAMSSTLNVYPKSLLNLTKLESMLMIEKGRLDCLTFLPVYKKFFLEDEKVSNSRLLDNLIHKSMKYCPICLRDDLIHKLIWQVKEIKVCSIHNISLLSCCWKCGKDIPMLTSDFVMGKCPHCHSLLCEITTEEAIMNDKDLLRYINWTYLLDPDSSGVIPINNLPIGQSLALKLLSILRKYNINVRNVSATNPILNLARNNKISQSLISLDSIFKILNMLDIPISTLFSTDASNKFIKGVGLQKEINPIDALTCLAPWCGGYKNPGTLKRDTRSKVKGKICGDYYVYCEQCGIKYVLDKNNSELTEKGYFISLAWGKIKDRLCPGITLKDLTKDLNCSSEKILRSVVFLVSNDLIKNDISPIELPLRHDEKIINEILILVLKGLPYKKIMKILHLPYKIFLFYIFCPSLLTQFRMRMHQTFKQLEEHEYKEKIFYETLKYFFANDIPIRVESIANYLKVSHSTLRNRGFLQEIRAIKKAQKLKLYPGNKVY